MRKEQVMQRKLVPLKNYIEGESYQVKLLAIYDTGREDGQGLNFQVQAEGYKTAYINNSTDKAVEYWLEHIATETARSADEVFNMETVISEKRTFTVYAVKNVVAETGQVYINLRNKPATAPIIDIDIADFETADGTDPF